jgi:hypothetical protein
MRWAPVVEKPDRDGQYFCLHPRMGKCVMGYVDGSWGNYPPEWWLQSDQCQHQAPDGSFGPIVQPMASKAYPIEDEL